MIALHARKSHASIAAFRAQRPHCPIVTVLTGTDVYRDIRTDDAAQESLEVADRLVVLQARALDELAPHLKRKAQIVHQSCATSLRHAPPRSKFRVCVIAHLREEKDPFCAVRALKFLEEDGAFEVLQVGAALDPQMERQALDWQSREKRYRWVGSVPHARALRWLATSHVTVVSSIMEGGANVISEAVSIGVPVLASRISGNLGMLGGRYRGYFDTGDEKALARLIQRCRSDTTYYRALRDTVAEKRAAFSTKGEIAAWRRILSSL